MDLLGGSVGFGTLALLVICLIIALGFEFVNGFHDTANAVATVIYTRSLKPGVAVVWSGLMNFLGALWGVFAGGAAVAFGIVHLLPVDLLINVGQSAGMLMVLSLLLSAVLWNVGTWYFGLPSSSSHALIGSILGVGLASSVFSPQGFGSGVNWGKATQTFGSLLISPLIGFTCAAILLLVMKGLIRDRKLYEEPRGEEPPPWWIRAVLALTCTGVSFAHGSNDGQKGMGLIMLILIGLLPAQYALNPSFNAVKVGETAAIVRETRLAFEKDSGLAATETKLLTDLRTVEERLTATPNLNTLPAAERQDLRATIMRADDRIGKLTKSGALFGDAKDAAKRGRKALQGVVDFVVTWVVVAVALALGIGTTVGWKRIVVTVGEKIGKTHLTYAQGAAAELTAMGTIFAADHFGLPVSTTHVLSSGVAGTMAANGSGLQFATVKKIALAWVLTLPVTMLLSGGLFLLTAGWFLKKDPPKPLERLPQRDIRLEAGAIRHIQPNRADGRQEPKPDAYRTAQVAERDFGLRRPGIAQFGERDAL
jgi:inorganic phosphate transporter, PiT family